MTEGTVTTPATATIGDAELPSRLRLTVMRLARRLRQQGDTEATLSQLSALSTIEREGPITLGELAGLERVAPPSMTRIVGRLEEVGYVTRHVDTADRRVARVALTSDGKKILAKSRGRKTAYLAARIEKMSDADRAVLLAALPVIERLVGDE